MAETATGQTDPMADLGRLDDWMGRNIAGYAGPLTAAKFPGGQSNPTYRLGTPSRDYVMRRKPSGPLLAGAHAVDREYRVIAALGGQDFPVPQALGYCADREVAGTEFFIMELVEGRVIWDATFADQPKSERAAYCDALNEVMARLHGIDYRAAGLADYGKPGNYFQRQIARWTRAYRDDELAGRIPALDRIADWLPANIPDDGDETCIVHGDYRCDNVMFHPTAPRIVAVLDWELSTLGNPLVDFTYHLMMYRTPLGLPGGIAGLDIKALGVPSEAEYVAAYCRRTGRKEIPALDFYIAFNMFRLAAIIHGIKGRVLRGTASSAEASRTAARLDDLAECAWQQARAAGAPG